MAKGAKITPFILPARPASASKSPADDATQPAAANLSRRSTSAIFPTLRRLETSGSDGGPSQPRPSTSSARDVRANVASSSKCPVASKSAPVYASSSSSSGPNTSVPIVTLKMTGPSFLDVVVRDGDTKEPMYIIETVRDSTFVYRLDRQPKEEAVKAATVQWPRSVVKGKSTGRSVQMGNGRWRDTEDFLKFGTLTNFLNRKFQLPHFPHALKWKPAPGNSFQCTTQGIKGPIASLEAAYLSAPPRLRVYQTLSDGDPDRVQQTYNGVPVVLLDYLLITSLLLVTEVQEWLDRPQNETGTVRIPGSSSSKVKKWLAIIHNEVVPASPTQTSPTTSVAPSPWESQNANRVSSGATSLAGSSSSDPMTPITPATSAGEFISPRDEEIPPVPPLPESARTRPLTLDVPQPHSAFAGPSRSFDDQSPILPLHTPISAPATTRLSARPLPLPPIRNTASATSLQAGPSTYDAIRPANTSESGPGTHSPVSSDRPSTPSSSSQAASRRSITGRRSLTVANLPPTQPPPSASLPLPPKLAQEMRLLQGSAPSYDEADTAGAPGAPGAAAAAPAARGATATGLQVTNPDPLPPEEEERLRRMALDMHAIAAGPATQQSSTSAPYLAVDGSALVSAVHPPGAMVDAGMISMGPGAARAYAHAVFDQPPPAYDAIDFSLPQVHIRSR